MIFDRPTRQVITVFGLYIFSPFTILHSFGPSYLADHLIFMPNNDVIGNLGMTFLYRESC